MPQWTVPELISVIIPAHNCLPLLDEQLEALAAQDYSGVIEVIVSDNGSSDDLLGHIRNHPLREQLSLRHVDSSTRRGAAHARNVGVAAAQGDFLAFCDADDRVHPGWLTALATAARHADAVSGPVETASISAPRMVEARPVRAPSESHDYPGFLRYFLAGNCGIWRDAWMHVGGYDETYTTGGEELDLSWRLQLAGHTIAHSPAALVAYRQRDSYRGLWAQSVAHSEAQVRLTVEYREYGLTRPHPLPLVLYGPIFAALLVLRNPLLPRSITRFPRGEWVMNAAMLVGRIRGAVRYRTWSA